MNWFQRHLNLTLIAVVVGTYLLTMVTSASAETTGQGRSIVGSLIQLVNPTISNQTMSWFYLPIWLALMLPVEGWVLSKKNRSMWHLLWAITPFGWIIILLFGSPKIDGKELQECLTYLEAENKVIAFQIKEADIYNNAMVEYGNSIMQNPVAAEDMKKAAKRLSQAAAEILKRHEKIQNIPVAALAMHSAWHTAFLTNTDWASAMVKAIESNIFALLDAAKRMNPEIEYAQQLAEKYHKDYRRAEDEYKKLLKRLKIGAEDKVKILASANIIDAAPHG